jgi:arylamine N-acetyltransferase
MTRLKFFERDNNGSVVMYTFHQDAVEEMVEHVKNRWKDKYEQSEKNWLELTKKDEKDGEMLLKNEDFRRVLYGE